MLKSILYTLLSLIILLNGMVYSVIQADFHMNRKEIASLFCVNQDRPELECNGKCELTKRLDKAQDQEEDHGKLVFEELLLTYTMPITAFKLQPNWKFTTPLFGILHQIENPLFNSNDFFHPPQG